MNRSSEYDKLELKHKKLVFTSLYALLKKMSWCETEMQKYMPLVTECNEIYRHLPLLVVPQGTTFLLSSRLDSAVKRCSSEVLKLSFQRSCSVKGLFRRD